MDAQYISRQNHQATNTDWGAAASVTPATGGRGVRFDGEGEERCDLVGGRANDGEKSPSVKSSTEGKIVRGD